MPVIQFREGHSGGGLEQPRHEVVWKAWPYKDHVEAVGAVMKEAPSAIRSVTGSPTWLDVIDFDYEEDSSTNGLWLITLVYGAKETGPLEPGEGRFSFKTTGGTKKILNSRVTRARYARDGSPKPAPYFGGAIGVTSGGIEGCEIIVGVYEFTEEHLVPASRVTDAYKRTIFELTGRTNNAPFKGCDQDECLFLGAEGEQQGKQGDWRMAFHFAGSPNQIITDIPGISGKRPGESATGVVKKGWDYLWVLFEDYEDTEASYVSKQPLAAYVEQVYLTGSFKGLGIGTGAPNPLGAST